MATENNHTTGNNFIHLRDAEVFDVTYKSYYHPLNFYAAKFVQPEDAEDIIENLFIKLWDKNQVFENTSHLQSFLYLAVRNACLDFIKVHQKTGQRSIVLEERSGLATADHLQTLIQAEVLAEIYRAINDLPSQCGKVIRMGYLEGLNNAAIAHELGLSEQTVKNYKGRGLSLLKNSLSGSTFTLLIILMNCK